MSHAPETIHDDTEDISSSDGQPAETAPPLRVLNGSLLGGAVGLVLSSVILAISRAMLDDGAITVPVSATGGAVELGYGMVAMACLIAAAASGMLAMLLTRESNRGLTVYMVLAAGVFAVSLYGPFAVDDTGGAQLALVAMHAVTAICVITGTRIGARPRPGMQI